MFFTCVFRVDLTVAIDQKLFFFCNYSRCYFILMHAGKKLQGVNFTVQYKQ